ncbi:MAG TPA: GGDEF domain-containing protein [Myxococcaceae bacterium]|nr:GGDEF domain-containing protein [Myxococcaceae bacterium]
MGKTESNVTVISKVDPRPRSNEAALVVIHGLELGKKFDLKLNETVVGRSSKADIQVDEESVSRNHATLINDGQKVAVKDLGSTNGTYVNDEQTSGEMTLRNGDLLRIGRTIFKFLAGGNIESAYHDEIYRLTTVDGLTQVFNRRYFQDAIEREISRCNRYGRGLALVMMDIDFFKRINDTYGHLAGDYCLKHLANTLRPRIRREDILARYGGEEFALILPELDIKGAANMAEKVRKLVESERFEFDKQHIPVTISLGCAQLEQSMTGPELIRAADAKLYSAKESGRNRVGS